MEILDRLSDYLNDIPPEYGYATRMLSPKRARRLLNESEQTFREEYLPFFWEYLRGAHRKLVGPDATTDEDERRNISYGTREARGYMRECGLGYFTPIPFPEGTPEEARKLFVVGPVNQALLFDGYNVLDDGYMVELVPLTNKGKPIRKERFILPVVIDPSARIGESRLTDIQWQGDEELIKRMFGSIDFDGNPVTPGVPALFRVGFGKIYAPETLEIGAHEDAGVDIEEIDIIEPEPVELVEEMEHEAEPIRLPCYEADNGNEYYIKPTFVFSRDSEGALDHLPDGWEIRENSRGVPYLQKERN